MVTKVLQEHNLSKRPLSIRLVSESIEYFFDGHYRARLLIDSLPNDSIGLLQTKLQKFLKMTLQGSRNSNLTHTQMFWLAPPSSMVTEFRAPCVIDQQSSNEATDFCFVLLVT
jgi:hypothetical protein